MNLHEETHRRSYGCPITEKEVRLQWSSGIMSGAERDLYVAVREENLHHESEAGEAALYAFTRVLDSRRST